MVEYELAGTDVADVRFAISPLTELTLSLRTFREPGRYPVHLPWLRRTEQARERLDVPLLTALTNEALWTPDYLTPRPHSPLTRIDDELEAAAGVPPHRLLDDLAAVHPRGLPAPLRGDPAQVRVRVAQALRTYWDTCFAPWWPRMRAVLQADVVHRGQVIGAYGLGAMFAGLSERIRLEDGVVRVRLGSPARFRRSTAGAGLTLVPTLFTRAASAPISPEEPPTIMYGARGAGNLWQAEVQRAPGVLTDLLGATRAGLLTALGDPASSSDLAGRLGVTVSAVNQHLRAMRAAGLLTSARHGRSVLYLRSELGDALVGRPG
ncbi:transcriptional regulator [Xylanimonas oleitrophica]|uniref:Transcriptional regulator n=1 Tax=Xylanimonas oleitrophica TaxID=2607479 RepID=A0A2W5WQG8_9MICO|nr:transcriptional regulator [Xylanimonas oleitrophica]